MPDPGSPFPWAGPPKTRLTPDTSHTCLQLQRREDGVHWFVGLLVYRSGADVLYNVFATLAGWHKGLVLAYRYIWIASYGNM